MTLKFQRFDEAHLPELMTWFPDRAALLIWGGSEFRFPFTAETFRDDAKVRSLPTWELAQDGALAGFGQCYLRVGRCHLGRLAISPAMRGRGLGTILIENLAAQGKADLGIASLSLFVDPRNEQASRLYRRLGFHETPYPEPSPQIDGYVYMVKTEDAT